MNRIPVIDMTATGVNIEKLRKAAGLTVKDVQDIFGFATPQAIYKWQRGQSLPSTDNLLVLHVLFRVPVEAIVCYSVSSDMPSGEIPGGVFLIQN